MPFGRKKASLVLFVGDLFFFTVALWLTLLVRHLRPPSQELFWGHLIPFSVIFLVWVIVFFISDLYHQRTLVLKRTLPALILRAQVVNSIIAVVCFYFIPYFSAVGVTPKTTLFIYLPISFLFIWWWRSSLFRCLYRGRPVKILFACSGPQTEELRQAILEQRAGSLVSVAENPDIIVFNAYDGVSAKELPAFYSQLFRGVHFIAVQELYEEIFERVPLDLINERWLLENISNQPKLIYDFFKRLMDIFISLTLAVVSLPFYLLIFILIKLDDGGPIFFRQARVGKNGRLFEILKFRSMRNGEVTTRLGYWLRRTRLDELPQLWSVVYGQQSLIGPRPERPEYSELYRQQLNYYDVRHLIPPGLSGWAQLYHENHPHFQPELDATAEKLSYDLYYVKNRNFWLDLKIALKTIKILLSVKGI